MLPFSNFLNRSGQKKKVFLTSAALLTGAAFMQSMLIFFLSSVIEQLLCQVTATDLTLRFAEFG